MHISCTKSEWNEWISHMDSESGFLKILPPDTYCLVSEDYDKNDEDARSESLFTYKWNGIGWIEIRNHKEYRRKATKEELDSADNLTQKQILESALKYIQEHHWYGDE